MESHGLAGEIQVTEATCAKAKDSFQLDQARLQRLDRIVVRVERVG